MRRGRGRGGRGGKRTREEETTETNAVASTTSNSSLGPQDYHYNVRKAIRAVLTDSAFQQICEAQGNVTISTEAILEGVCGACDVAAMEPPIEAAVSRDTIEENVRKVVSASCSCDAVVHAFSVGFSERAATFVPKLPPAAASDQPRSTQEEEVADQPTATRGTGRGRGHRGGGRGGPNAAQEAAPSHAGEYGVLPMPPPFHGGALLAPPTYGGGLLPTPAPQMSMTMGYAMPPPTYFPSQPAQQPQVPTLPPCTCRCVALENVPAHFISGESLRPQLQTMCARLKSVYFFNTAHIEGTNTVVVSVNSADAATALVARINYTSHVDGSPVVAREATAQEMDALWAPQRASLRQWEEETQQRLDAYDASSVGAMRTRWHAAHTEGLRLDQELERLMGADGAVNPAAKLALLQAKLAVKQEQDACVAALAAMNESLDGPADPCSSSSASAGGGGSLLYLSNLPPHMPDKKFLAFFQALQPFATLVHVWRDASCPTRICCAFLNAGQVFAVLRALDCNEWTLCGVSFSKTRPAPSSSLGAA